VGNHQVFQAIHKKGIKKEPLFKRFYCHRLIVAANFWVQLKKKASRIGKNGRNHGEILLTKVQYYP